MSESGLVIVSATDGDVGELLNDDGMPYWAWIIVGVGAFLLLLLLALGVAFFARRRRNLAATQAGPSVPDSTVMRESVVASESRSSSQVHSNQYQSLVRRRDPYDVGVVGADTDFVSARAPGEESSDVFY